MNKFDQLIMYNEIVCMEKVSETFAVSKKNVEKVMNTGRATNDNNLIENKLKMI